MSESTIINTEINSTNTVINKSVLNSGETVLNTQAVQVTSLAEGSVIFDKYRITGRMSGSTAEAQIYLCEYLGEQYAVKVYNREKSVKPEVISVLKSINSKYVAHLQDFGEIDGKAVEVMQYFKNGSLDGRVFSLEELKSTVIPCINEGLKVLHSCGLIHKDLKPSNIMLNDDGKGVSIIDFGISSVEQDGNTVILTRTGMTPEYSAPETFRGLFLEESDYYSLGILVYELFSGETPYRNLSAEQIAQYTAIQKIPIRDNFPDELKNLVTALTYCDITNRNDPDNPDRRWTYKEVKNWCNGKSQPIPGKMRTQTSTVPPYRFMNSDYRSIPELTKALSMFWKEGKKQLFRGLMSGFFKNFNPQTAEYCLDAEEMYSEGKESDDLIFFRLLYKINPDMLSFEWKGRSFESISSLGRCMLTDLRNGESIDYYSSILEYSVLSEYLSCINESTDEQKSAVKALENSYRTSENNRQHLTVLFLTAYMLSGSKTLVLNGSEFSNIQQLASYASNLIGNSYSSFQEFCNTIIDSNNNLDVQFESWLISSGKQKELENWKNKINRL